MKKTLTTLSAVAALMAGVSLAGAQGAPSTNVKPSPGSMDRGAYSTQQSGQPDKGNAMSSTNQKISGRSKFCMQESNGSLNCKFASLTACQKAAKSGQSCSPNPRMGTTGAK